MKIRALQVLGWSLPLLAHMVATAGQPGLFGAIGHNEDTVKVRMIGLNWIFGPHKAYADIGTWQPSLEVLFSDWDSDPGQTGVTALQTWAVSGYLRYQLPGHITRNLYPYLEAGFGVHHLSETKIEDPELGQPIQFGSKVGLGLTLWKRADIGLRLRHLSNAGLSHPNWGMNHLLLRLGLRF